MGWTLGRYLFMRYAVITTWLFFGIFALVFIIDFAEFSSRVSGLPNFSLKTAFIVSALRVPMFMLQTVPFVALFSAMALLVALNRRSELVIARAAGLSAWQFLLPACLGAFLFGLVIILAFNPLAASALSRSELIETNLREGDSAGGGASVVPWLRQKVAGADTIIGARATLEQGMVLADASFFQLDAAGDIIERINAERATLRDGHWELENVERYKDGKRETGIQILNIPTNLRPEFVQERLARPETIPLMQLPEKIEVARSFGLRANAFSMQLHSLLALPLLLVAMTLIAATVSLRFTRLGQSATLILGGVAAGFLLYVVSVLVKAFGTSGIVPPLVAAWFPVAVAIFFGVTFLLYREDG